MPKCKKCESFSLEINPALHIEISLFMLSLSAELDAELDEGNSL